MHRVSFETIDIGAKEYAKYFKEQYENAGLLLLYSPWNPIEVNWKVRIERNKCKKQDSG